MFCIKNTFAVDPFYIWSQGCEQVVPMTREYPFAPVIKTAIPSWASKQLSSGGNFDPSAVMRSEFSYLPLFSFYPVFSRFASLPPA